MYVSRLLSLAALLLPVLLPGYPDAAEPDEPKDMRPALQRTDSYALAGNVEFPENHLDGADFQVTVPCNSGVDRQGNISLATCFGGDEASRAFEFYVSRATERSKMIPATINGRRRPVSIYFTVVFRRHQGVASVMVFPHQFLNAATLGAEYVAPQLITDEFYGRLSPLCRNMRIMFRFTVDTKGRTKNPRLHRGDASADACVRAVERRVKRLRFVPGQVDGKPVEMDHLYTPVWRGAWL